MLNFLEVIENSKALDIVKKDLSNGRLSHAYLFLSPDENYLTSFCEYVCKLLINDKNEEVVNKNNLRIDKHIHPDVKFFGEEKAIDVKIATQIVEEADFSPFESDKKIFVILNAGEMNEASQNKILKTIEEPPKNTYFLLAAASKSRILQTILSRVKEIKLEEISPDGIEHMLVETGVPAQNAQIVASCANGNATFAEKISLDKNFIQFYNSILAMFSGLEGSKDVLKFSVMFTDKKVDKNEFFDIATGMIRDLLVIKAGSEKLILNKNILPNLKEVAKKLNEASLIELLGVCVHCKEMLAFNVSGAAVVDEFLFKLAEVKVKCRRL